MKFSYFIVALIIIVGYHDLTGNWYPASLDWFTFPSYNVTQNLTQTIQDTFMDIEKETPEFADYKSSLVFKQNTVNQEFLNKLGDLHFENFLKSRNLTVTQECLLPPVPQNGDLENDKKIGFFSFMYCPYTLHVALIPENSMSTPIITDLPCFDSPILEIDATELFKNNSSFFNLCLLDQYYDYANIHYNTIQNFQTFCVNKMIFNENLLGCHKVMKGVKTVSLIDPVLLNTRKLVALIEDSKSVTASELVSQVFYGKQEKENYSMEDYRGLTPEEQEQQSESLLTRFFNFWTFTY